MSVNTLDMQSLHSTTLPETNSSHLKLDGWNTSFLLGWPMFMGYVRFGEGIVTQKLLATAKAMMHTSDAVVQIKL